MPHRGDESFNARITFPNLGWQIVTLGVYILTLTCVSGLLARRLALFKSTLTKPRPLYSPWLCDALVLGVYLVSYIFLVINGFLTYGLGTAHNESTCDASVTVCVTIFVVSKVLLYLFFLERLQMVNAGTPPRFLQRFRDVQWLIGAAIFTLGVPSAVLLGFSRKFELIYKDGNSDAIGCVVGLIPGFAVPVIVWCGVIKLYYLLAYWKVSTKFPEQRRLARRCLVALLVSGISTCINLSVLVLLKREHGIECGTICCAIDVTINAFALSLVSSHEGEEVQLFGALPRHSPATTYATPIIDSKSEE